VVLVSTYYQLGIPSLIVKVHLLQVVHLQITRKTATVQSRPIPSPAGNNELADYKQSRDNALHYPIFMGCME